MPKMIPTTRVPPKIPPITAPGLVPEGK